MEKGFGKFSEVVALGLIVAGLTFSGGARSEAAPAHVWVSPLGSSSGTGATTSPVQTLAQAYAKVGAGGEINIRDSADFTGGLLISKSITIDGAGCQAAISHNLVQNAGLTILGEASVTLRNLTFNGHGLGNAGINVGGNAGTVNVENCTFTGSMYGLFVVPQSTVYVKISNCSFKNLSESAILFSTNAGNVFGTIENVEVSNCGAGLSALNGSRFTMRNSTLNSNGYGIFMSQRGASSKGAVDNCMLTNNSIALSFANLCTARVIETSFVQNSVLYQNVGGGGVFQSDGTNVKISNATEGPAPTPLPNF